MTLLTTIIALLFTLAAARQQQINPNYGPGSVVPSSGQQNYAAPPNEQYCKLLAGTNKYRTSFNRVPLVGDRRLDDAAAVHCRDMGNAGVLDHNVYGSTPAQRVANQGYGWSGVAENIYSEYGRGGSSPERAVEAWYNSPGHRTNMMGNYNSVGYAECVGRDGKNYYAQVFGNGDYNPHTSYDEVTCGYQPPRQEYRQEQPQKQQQPEYHEAPSNENYDYHHQEERPAKRPKYDDNQDYQKPTTERRPSTYDNSKPTTSYKAPASDYKAPASGYKAPSSGYKAPSSGYKAPSSGYKAPSTGQNYQIRYGSNGKPVCKVTMYGAKSKGASKPMKKSKAKSNPSKAKEESAVAA